MKKNYDIRFNPRSLSKSEIARHKDFDALLGKFEEEKKRPIQKPLILRIGYLAAAIAAAITVLFIIYYGIEGEDYSLKEQAYFASQDFVNPPLNQVKAKFASYQVDANQGGIYKYPSGSQLTIPASAFIGKDGEEVSGEVTIHYREMHDFVDFFLSGIPMTYDSAGVEYTLESAGMIEIFAEQNGNRVRMAPGKSIDVELVSNVNVSPQLQVPEGFNIYKLDTEKRQWVYQEIDRIEVLEDELAFGDLEEDDPLYAEKKQLMDRMQAIQINGETALANIESSIPRLTVPVKPVKASDDHAFSLDLSDLIAGETERTNSSTDNELTALYQKYESMLWQVSPNSAVSVEQLQAFGSATGMRMNKLNGHDFELILEKENSTIKVLVNPVLSGDEYESALAEYQRDLQRFQELSDQREQQLKKEKEALQLRLNEEKRLAQLNFEERIAELRANGMDYAAMDEIVKKKVINRFRATGFGVWNCDRPLPPDLIILSASFKDESGNKFNNKTGYLVDQNRNTVYRFLVEDGAPFRFNANSNNLLWLMTEENKIAVFRPEDFREIPSGIKEHIFELNTIDKKIENEEDVREVLYL